MQILIEKKHIWRETDKLLFVDDKGVAFYKHVSFDREYRYLVTEVVESDVDQDGQPRVSYFGYRLDRQGKQYQGAKGNVRYIVSSYIVRKYPDTWRIEEAQGIASLKAKA